MGILRRLREWREDKDGTLIGPNIEADSVDAGSVKTDEATHNNSYTDPDGNTYSGTVGLPASAGFATGDFQPIFNTAAISQGSVDFTNTSYTGENTFSRLFTRWDGLPYSGSKKAIYGEILVIPGTDETCSARIRNATDGDTIIEQTGISSRTQVQLGPTEYTPSTTDSDIELKWNWKTDTGTNTNTVFLPIVGVGVKL